MENQKQTLIILTPGFPSNEQDTTCLPFLQNHVLTINSKYPGIEVVIFAFQYPDHKQEYLWYGNQVFCGNGMDKSGFTRYAIWLKVWRKLTFMKRSKNIIGLFSLWCTECALVGSYFGKVHGIKHRNWLCGQDAKKGNKYVKYIKPQPNELVAMSDFLAREFRSNYGVFPAHVIPVGVESLNTSIGHVRDIDVLGVGSLIPLKQYDIFIRVIAELAKNSPHVNAKIFGSGPQKEVLEVLLKELEVTQNVVFMGTMPHADILQQMQRAKIFLHTSSYEGFGTVCLEALSAGCHVVSFTRPMDMDIEHWHHVDGIDEMVAKVGSLLKDTALTNTLVVPFSVIDSTRSIVELFS